MTWMLAYKGIRVWKYTKGRRPCHHFFCLCLHFHNEVPSTKSKVQLSSTITTKSKVQLSSTITTKSEVRLSSWQYYLFLSVGWKNIFPLEGIYVQGPETYVQGPETTVHSPWTGVSGLWIENILRRKEKSIEEKKKIPYC